jgi:ATP-dependent Clp protease ATP-binding subunit ClpC
MSEYMEKHNVSRLIGAPPGYVGYEEGGQLTEKIRRRPYAVVLLDEIEKAHPDVFNMLLQIMEEGHLTDSFGRKVDFKNTVLIMTTNVGAKEIAFGSNFGFGARDEERSYDRMKQDLMNAIESEFKPEFLGRLDELVVFRPLTGENLKQIVEIELSKVRERLAEKGLALILNEEAKALIVEKGGATEFGARPLRRAVESFIEDPLSEEILRGAFEGFNTIHVSVKQVADQKRLDFLPSMEETPVGELVAASSEPVSASDPGSTDAGTKSEPAL